SVLASSQAEIDKHLELGKKLLAAGQLADALSHYHAAIELDPTNYQSYFRRATVYMAIGKSKPALPDLDKVIELKPDFATAYLQPDLRRVLELDPSNAEAAKQIEQLTPLAEFAENARNLAENGQYTDAIDFLTRALEISPMDADLRALRADAYEAIGEGFKAASDLRAINRLTTDNTAGHLRVSHLFYRLGDPEQSLNEVRECLKLDPDHKDCFKHYKQVKKVAKAFDAVVKSSEEKQWDVCLQSLEKLTKTIKQKSAGLTRQMDSYQCMCGAKNGDSAAVDVCSRVLEAEPGNADALCNRAEAYKHQDMFNEAIADYQKVLETDKNNQRAKEGIADAQKKLKSSRRRNYYQILGVPRSARKREILKAYRKLAAQYHPDHYKGNDKASAQRKFIDISDAKEVLTDEEKRKQYDSGHDPLDPEQQQGGGGGPGFQHFNQFFQGSGFQFRFHFN
uniref:J domain-containing protein n=1 Tax=Macrostomum lignano TaxID=282301 RepID=A0A1I8GNB4_9PLAT